MDSSSTIKSTPLHEILKCHLIFVHGKGGVGKSTLAYSLSQILSESKKTLLVSIEDPTLDPGIKKTINARFDHLNNDSKKSFEEYISIKMGSPLLAKLFFQNKLMQYLASAAPGTRELTLLGKIWYELKSYDHVVVDMPATGHGLTMLQAVQNWAKLFKGSIFAKDSEEIIRTLNNPKKTGNVICALPEEMPLVESLELYESLGRIIPHPLVSFIANRVFPLAISNNEAPTSLKPYSETALEHVIQKNKLENDNLKQWGSFLFLKIPYFEPYSTAQIQNQMVDYLNQQLKENKA